MTISLEKLMVASNLLPFHKNLSELLKQKRNIKVNNQAKTNSRNTLFARY